MHILPVDLQVQPIDKDLDKKSKKKTGLNPI